MSADLFAEFGGFSGSSQPSQQQESGSAAPGANPPPANSPFSFSNQGAHHSVQGQAAWPGLQPSRWGSTLQDSRNGGIQEKSTPPPEDEDGWGDFEVASPVMDGNASNLPSPTPASAPMQTSFGQTQKHAASASSSQPPEPQRSRIVRASTIDLMSNNLLDVGQSAAARTESPQTAPSWERPATRKSPRFKPKSSDPNVLFDADDFELGGADEDDEEDDFGDFETGTFSSPVPGAELPAAQSATASIDLMSQDWSAPLSTKSARHNQPPSQLLSTLSLDSGSHYPQAPKSPGFQDRNPFPGLAVSTPKAEEFSGAAKPKSPSPVTVWPSLEQKTPTKPKDDFGNGWDAFEDQAPAQSQTAQTTTQDLGWEWDALDSKNQAKKSSAPKPQPKSKPKPKQVPIPISEPQNAASDWGWDDAEVPTAATPEPAALSKPRTTPDDRPPPTNVPPPSILLSIFPSLFDLLDTAIFKPTSTQPAAARNKVLAAPKAAEFLRGYLHLAVVAARIVAGRKQRWHRDRFLAQSMSISAAGGKGGMKLAGVDRAQSVREDREAADVAAAWRRHVGRLRSAVATANSSLSSEHLKVPEVSETLAVQTAKMVPTAPKACVVCGLKREERVKGVDFEVEDSFGEWWVEHWGHRACRNFWLEHEVRLRSR